MSRGGGLLRIIISEHYIIIMIIIIIMTTVGTGSHLDLLSISQSGGEIMSKRSGRIIGCKYKNLLMAINRVIFPDGSNLRLLTV